MTRSRSKTPRAKGPDQRREAARTVLAEIGRKKGNQLDTLPDRHGVVEKMIRNCLDRFAEEPIEQAPYDAPRPREPAKIEGEDRERLFEQLQQPPTELGYDQQAWSAKLLLHHAKEEYGEILHFRLFPTTTKQTTRWFLTELHRRYLFDSIEFLVDGADYLVDVLNEDVYRWLHSDRLRI